MRSLQIRPGRAGRHAASVAGELANHERFKSHSRHIDGQTASEIGLKIRDLEADHELQDMVLSVFHATNITLQQGIIKIIENHLGRPFLKSIPATP